MRPIPMCWRNEYNFMPTGSDFVYARSITISFDGIECYWLCAAIFGRNTKKLNMKWLAFASSLLLLLNYSYSYKKCNDRKLSCTMVSTKWRNYTFVVGQFVRDDMMAGNWTKHNSQVNIRLPTAMVCAPSSALARESERDYIGPVLFNILFRSSAVNSTLIFYLLQKSHTINFSFQSIVQFLFSPLAVRDSIYIVLSLWLSLETERHFFMTFGRYVLQRFAINVVHVP